MYSIRLCRPSDSLSGSCYAGHLILYLAAVMQVIWFSIWQLLCRSSDSLSDSCYAGHLILYLAAVMHYAGHPILYLAAVMQFIWVTLYLTAVMQVIWFSIWQLLCRSSDSISGSCYAGHLILYLTAASAVHLTFYLTEGHLDNLYTGHLISCFFSFFDRRWLIVMLLTASASTSI